MASLSLTSRESEMKEGDGMMSDSSSASMERDLDKSKARLSKLERVKKKLRDRDSRLSVLMKDNNNSSLLAGDIKPYEKRTSVGEADSKEAVRVLSYAAFKLQRQVDKKSGETKALRRTVDELEESLQEKEKEKSTLVVDMNIFRKSLQAYSDQIDRLAQELDTKNKTMEALIHENDHQRQQAQEWKGKLDASRKDYEWMRKESMSKSEQVEYFEYELLSKNDEIDKLHAEFDQKLRRIAELEVDTELMEARSSRSLEKKEATYSMHDITSARSVSVEEVDPAAGHTQHKAPKRSAFSILRELKCQSRAEDTEVTGGLIVRTFSDGSNNGSFPTDMSTDTTAVISNSTDASSPPRVRRSTGRRSGKGTKGSQDHQHIDIIDNLRSDLLAIEAKYMEDKYNSTKLIETLKQENNEYLIKLVCLDCKTRNKDDRGTSLALLLEDIDDGADGSSSLFEGSAMSSVTPVDSKANMLRTKSFLATGSKLPNKGEYLQKKTEHLEGERLVQQRTIEELTTKLSELETIARNRANADKRSIDDLIFQNEAQAMKISELERSRFSESFKGDQERAPEYAASLEDKVQKQSIDIEKLQMQNDLKDRTIEALRAQLVDQRVRQQFV